MKYITRWGLMRNTVAENIKEHSHEVAVIAHALAIMGNKYYNRTYDVGRVTQLALFHETSEVITGDLVTPIKYYNPEINSAYKSLEKVANYKLLGMLPQELREEYEQLLLPQEDEETLLVKAADKIGAYLKCVEELKAGNREFVSASKSILEAIESFDLPEVKMFMEKFVPSFSLTLDELN